MYAQKRRLFIYKAKLLELIKHFDRQIESVKFRTKQMIRHEYESEDSDDEFLTLGGTGPSPVEEPMLQLCLQTTKEITGFHILSSQDNILHDTSVLDKFTPNTEKGTWREVKVEGMVDLVWCIISFYVNKPIHDQNRITYFGLNTTVQKHHGGELNASVLSDMLLPSDAVEVIRSYSAAYRSRQATLKLLANKHPDIFSNEPLPTGGYLLHFEDVFKMTWVLVNTWSPLKPFENIVEFQMEFYIGETIARRLEQVRDILFDDAMIDTVERSSLLNMFVSICLEGKGQSSNSMESDLESNSTLYKSYNNTMESLKSLPIEIKPKRKNNKPHLENKRYSNKDDFIQVKLDNGMARKVSKEAIIKTHNNIEDIVNENMAIDSVANNNKDEKCQLPTKDQNVKAAQNKEFSLNNVANTSRICKIIALEKINTHKVVQNKKKDTKANAQLPTKNKNVKAVQNKESSQKNVATSKKIISKNAVQNKEKRITIKETGPNGNNDGNIVTSINKNAQIGNIELNKDIKDVTNKNNDKETEAVEIEINDKEHNICNNKNLKTVTTKKCRKCVPKSKEAINNKDGRNNVAATVSNRTLIRKQFNDDNKHLLETVKVSKSRDNMKSDKMINEAVPHDGANNKQSDNINKGQNVKERKTKRKAKK